MNDSTNIRIIADNIRKLNSKYSNLEKDFEDAAARIPKDYSTTEVDTGLKWIDGKPIYSKVYSGTLPQIEGSSSNVEIATLTEKINIIDTSIVVGKDSIYRVGINRFGLSYSTDTDKLAIVSVSSTYSEGYYNVPIYYTKIEASKSPDEPEEKTTKKTKKKG